MVAIFTGINIVFASILGPKRSVATGIMLAVVGGIILKRISTQA